MTAATCIYGSMSVERTCVATFKGSFHCAGGIDGGVHIVGKEERLCGLAQKREFTCEKGLA